MKREAKLENNILVWQKVRIHVFLDKLKLVLEILVSSIPDKSFPTVFMKFEEHYFTIYRISIEKWKVNSATWAFFQNVRNKNISNPVKYPTDLIAEFLEERSSNRYETGHFYSAFPKMLADCASANVKWLTIH